MVSETQRLDCLRTSHHRKNMTDLEVTQSNQLSQLKAKFKIEENSLIVRMKKDYDVLSKSKALHENHITKIHSQSSKSAIKFGKEYGALKRDKRA